MGLGGWRFVPRLLPTLAAAAMFALLLSLGRWQVLRAGEKEERQGLLEARVKAPALALEGRLPALADVVYRRVVAQGRYLPDGQVFIDNRQHQGRAGFHVITPLKLDGSASTVLVNRGWIARNADYPRAPAVPVPEGRVSVAGQASVPPARVLELSAQTVSGNVWQNLSIARYRERIRLDVPGFVLLAQPPSPGLATVTEAPDAGIAKNREYALTWFSLAATVAILWIALNLRRD